MNGIQPQLLHEDGSQTYPNGSLRPGRRISIRGFCFREAVTI
ncbi:MAG: hypothetical protein R3E12_06355 [Candidatus Eisenbacteria bacterium]